MMVKLANQAPAKAKRTVHKSPLHAKIMRRPNAMTPMKENSKATHIISNVCNMSFKRGNRSVIGIISNSDASRLAKSDQRASSLAK